MTAKEILDMDISDIREIYHEDKRKYYRMVSTLRSVARKRYERAIEKDVDTPPIRLITEEGGFKSIKGMTPRQVMAQFQKLKGFLEDPLTTAEGAQKFFEESLERAGFKGDVSTIDRKTLQGFWDVWSGVKSKYGYLSGKDAAKKYPEYEAIKQWIRDVVSGDVQFTDDEDLNKEIVTNMVDSAVEVLRGYVEARGKEEAEISAKFQNIDLSNAKEDLLFS